MCPPLVFGWRGIIKDFPKSRIAKACGAAAYIRNSQPGRKRSPPSLEDQCCLYCDGPLFEVTAFSNTFDSYCKMYDAYMERSGEDGYDSNGEETEEEEWSSVTGYVCTGGHLLLGLFGDSKPTAGNLVPHSGKGLEIEQGIVKFLADEMTERQGDLSEGARFVESLALQGFQPSTEWRK